jgi:hypothetical protein
MGTSEQLMLLVRFEIRSRPTCCKSREDLLVQITVLESMLLKSKPRDEKYYFRLKSDKFFDIGETLQ